jgi:hypothetical protein
MQPSGQHKIAWESRFEQRFREISKQTGYLIDRTNASRLNYTVLHRLV